MKMCSTTHAYREKSIKAIGLKTNPSNSSKNSATIPGEVPYIFVSYFIATPTLTNLGVSNLLFQKSHRHLQSLTKNWMGAKSLKTQASEGWADGVCYQESGNTPGYSWDGL